MYPTDTVYGIGCDPYNSKAVARIFQIKRRSPTMPLPVLARSTEDVAGIAVLGNAAARLGSVFWPGGLTLILELADDRLGRSMNLDRRVAVRVPSGECVEQILLECRYLVGTSANTSGEPSVRDPFQIRGMERCDILVDGGMTPGGESTIVDVTGSVPRIVRDGVIPHQRILEEI